MSDLARRRLGTSTLESASGVTRENSTARDPSPRIGCHAAPVRSGPAIPAGSEGPRAPIPAILALAHVVGQHRQDLTCLKSPERSIPAV
jgi:hypothetical protein